MNSVCNIYNIFKRELRSYITSPMFYVVLAAFFFFSGLLFMMSLNNFDEYCKTISSQANPTALQSLDINAAVLTGQLSNIAFICIFFLPVFTMKLIAEERKNKTLELLMTSPISSYEIIIGKFLSVSVIWVLILAITFTYVALIVSLPYIQIYWSTYFTALFGLFLFGLLGISIGLFSSTLTENQLISAVIGFVISASIYFLANVYQVADSLLANISYKISSFTNFIEIARGNLDTSCIIYFVTATAFLLFLSERVLESQRWR